MTRVRWVFAAVLLAVAVLVPSGMALLAANPDVRAVGQLVVLDDRISADPRRGVVQVPCAGPDEEQGSVAVSIAVRNDGALPLSLGEAETLRGVDGPVATVSYQRSGAEPRARALVPPGGRVAVVLYLTVAPCGPGHNEATTSTIRQVTLPVRSLGVASRVVVDLPTDVTVPGLVDITPLDPFGCTVGMSRRPGPGELRKAGPARRRHSATRRARPRSPPSRRPGRTARSGQASDVVR